MKKQILLVSVIILALTTIGCGKSWTCSTCGKTWLGKAYTDWYMEATMCEDCAMEYWIPLPYEQYEISKDFELKVPGTYQPPADDISDSYDSWEQNEFEETDFTSTSETHTISLDEISYSELHDGTIRIDAYFGNDAETIIVPEQLNEYVISKVNCYAFDDYFGSVLVSDNIKYENPENDFEYIVKNDTIIITDYVGRSDVVYIPDIIDGLPVVELGTNSFNHTITHLDLPETLVTIADRALRGKFESLIFPDSLKEIGEGVLDCCSEMEHVKLPDNCTYIAPDLDYTGVTLLATYGSPTYDLILSSGQFADTPRHLVTAYDDNYYYTEYADNVIIYRCRYVAGDVYVPQYYNGKPITEVSSSAFSDTDAERIFFPEGIMCIGGVGGYNLTEIEYPSTVTKIGTIAGDNIHTIRIHEGASTGYNDFGLRFDELNVFCDNLTSIYIPASIQFIGFISGDYVTIYTVEGSYAQQYAYEEGIDCEVVEPW